MKFHDHEVVEISVVRAEKTVTLGLLDPESNKRTTVVMSGVERFTTTNMQLQNVILDAMILDSSTPVDYLNRVCELLDVLPTQVEHNSRLKLFYIEPSVGAEIACWCEQVTGGN